MACFVLRIYSPLVCIVNGVHVHITLYNIPFRDCLKFCFMHLIEMGMEKTVTEWNSHRIHPSTNSSSPAADELYFVPQLIGNM